MLPMLTVLGVLGGIYTGTATLKEAAAVGAVGAAVWAALSRL